MSPDRNQIQRNQAQHNQHQSKEYRIDITDNAVNAVEILASESGLSKQKIKLALGLMLLEILADHQLFSDWFQKKVRLSKK